MTNILEKFREYPRQFWQIFFGRFLAMSGVSMIWPFLLLYVSKKLDLPLTQTATLMTINAIMGIIASLVAGPLIDRIGRKGIMVISLFAHASIYMLMSQAETYLAFALLMALSGIANPIYRVGADAMVADLIDQEKRAEAYALVRWSNNLGVAMGPAIGGCLVVISYALTFKFAASGMLIYSLLLLFFARETLPQTQNTRAEKEPRKASGGYHSVLQDKSYLSTMAVIAV